LQIDGKLDEAAWGEAPWSESFVDIEGDKKPAPHFRTRFKMLWSQESLFIGVVLEEPHVWGTITRRDAVIYHDNDFEVFVDPDADAVNYYEIEINALGTVFDLLLNKPYRQGGRAGISWNAAGLKTAVFVDGSLNDPSDTDRSWSLEMAIPFSTLAEFCTVPVPPRPGDLWKINFSRVQWQHQIVEGSYRKVPKTREYNWVWNPTHVIDMHRPHRWGQIEFVGPAKTN
jgi:hypothetical protein